MLRCQTYGGTLWKRIADEQSIQNDVRSAEFYMINPNIIISAINLLKQQLGTDRAIQYKLYIVSIFRFSPVVTLD